VEATRFHNLVRYSKITIMTIRTLSTAYPTQTIRSLKYIATARTIPSFRSAGRYPHTSLIDQARQAKGLGQRAAATRYHQWKVANRLGNS
jgi:hypothetical protein